MSKIYELGKVYALRSFNTDLIYIGSTSYELRDRLCKHKSAYKGFKAGTIKNKCMSFDLFEKYNDVYIELIEQYENVTKEQLRKYEGEHQRKNKEILINKVIEGRDWKEYYKDHEEQEIARRKKRYEENKDHEKTLNIEYRKKNSNKIKEKNKEWRNNNKDKIHEKNTKTAICECGIKYTVIHKTRHEATERHKNLMKDITK